MANHGSTLDGPIGVMLVHPCRIVLSGLQRIIDDERPRLAVVGTATDGASATLLAQKLKPDVVVLDAGLSVANGGNLMETLITGPDTRVLLLGDPRHKEQREAAILRGACGVMQREDTPGTLVRAIEKVHEGELWLDRFTAGRLFLELSPRKSLAAQDPSQTKIGSLTEREQEVVRTLVTNPGADNKTLAKTLHIGEHTLRNHLSRIYDKLGVPNRVELYIFAQRHDLT